MSVRVIALYLLVGGLSLYAWKDWFKSLCGLILLMAVIEHEDMPKTMFGIQGLNLWNVLLVMIALAWVVRRRREGLRWDMPRHVGVLLLLYVGVLLAGVVRAGFDLDHLDGYPLTSLLSEELINTVKWILPGLLLFDGCRTRRRVIIALTCLLVMYVLIATQAVRRLPPSSVFQAGGELTRTRKICYDIGYGACDMSTMLAGVSWGIVAALPLIGRKMYRVPALAAAGVVLYGQALTGGRAGYLAWGVIGLVLCLLKWRKCLLLGPVVVILLPMIFPGAAQRMLSGFDATDAAGQGAVDDYAVTSGRTLIWPLIIDKIGESPAVGYGRLGMVRNGLAQYILQRFGEGEAVTQAHNMYLETLLDNGVVGSVPFFLFWGLSLAYSGRLFRSGNRLYSAIGGLGLALTLAQLAAGIGSQHFYPEESTLGMWAAMFLSFRVSLEERRAQLGAVAAANGWEPACLACPNGYCPG